MTAKKVIIGVVIFLLGVFVGMEALYAYIDGNGGLITDVSRFARCSSVTMTGENMVWYTVNYRVQTSLGDEQCGFFATTDESDFDGWVPDVKAPWEK